MISKYKIEETTINGLYKISVFNADDLRGHFIKDYAQNELTSYGIKHELKEVFYTVSHKGVIRALHFQRIKQQAKMVRCISGHVWDVVVDLRKDSPTFKQWLSFDLTGFNNTELLIPGGCAHGYLVLEDSIVSYKCSEQFYPEYDDGIKWDDPEIGIKWPLSLIGGIEKLIIAPKDENLQSFKDFNEKYTLY